MLKNFGVGESHLGLNTQQIPERAAPDSLTVLPLPIEAAWLVADKHTHNPVMLYSREGLLLSTQVGNTNRMLTIAVGHAVALRAANSVFFLMLPPLGFVLRG